MTAEAPTKILNRIRALLDKAESTTFEGEADSYRQKAEELMAKYRVEEEALIAQDPQAILPTSTTMNVTSSKEFGNQYFSMLWFIAKHMGVEVRGTWAYDKEVRGSAIVATLVGYETDLRFVDVLFTSARMAFSAHLEPKVDPTLTDQANAYRMRKAGMERNRIANALWKSAMDDGTAHGKVAALYKAECALRMEPATLSGRGINAKLYRKQYADTFAHRIWERLRRARDGADKAGGLPQLSGREDRVKEHFYTLFPEERPVPTTTDVEVTDGKKAKKIRPYRVTKADLKRAAQANRPEARAARGEAVKAADQVAIDGSEPAKRIDDRTDEERETTRQVRGVLGG